MYRKAYEKLLEWKQSRNRQPLIVEGARQVGKTWLIKEFGKNEYQNFVYVNCDNNPLVETIFRNYDIGRIVREISAIYETEIQEENTLIFFDEIQEIPKGIASLKYFSEESSYQVIAAGSLLGLNIHTGTGIPVGKVDILKLYPLSFEEFLLALGRNQLVERLRKGNWDELTDISDVLEEYLRQYYYVGGMPGVVNEFVDTNSYLNVRKIQNQIVDLYEKDMSKHASKDLIPKIHAVWQSLPSQLAKENKKFIYGLIKSGARAKEFENAIQWLIDAGLIHRITRVNKICEPLKFYEDYSSFKLFACDIGLLGALGNVPAEKLLVSNNGFVEYKGALTEQYVAQEYLCNSDSPLFYYTNMNSTLEIDFLFEKNKIYLVEVKAEQNLRSKSLKVELEKNESVEGLRYSMSGFKQQDRITNIPLYYAGQSFKKRNPELETTLKRSEYER